ncbi:MAG: 5'-methylthioadenosine/S-adenosylhomocysteine nucleosidase [Clostridiaceae bacterium]|nr:5'-methylthioadenosine/S-adenosylhomocysteine nucleosidase [Clostridiaceae bacterium]
MVLFVTALMIEALPIIEHFKLKRDMDIHEYAVYKNQDMVLIVSGVGKIRSAVALAYLYAKTGATEKDIAINIGFCGASNKKYPLGTLLIINKIIDMDTGKHYYPDVFFGRQFPKESLHCYSKVLQTADMDKRDQGPDIFCDMESAGFMEAAKKFFYAHNIAVLKLISDYLEPDNLNKTQLKGFVQKHLSNLETIINELKQINTNCQEFSFTEEEKEVFINLSQNLQFTEAMKQMFIKEMKIYKLKGGNPLSILKPFMDEKANTKDEAKKFFEQIKQRSRETNV